MSAGPRNLQAPLLVCARTSVHEAAKVCIGRCSVCHGSSGMLVTAGVCHATLAASSVMSGATVMPDLLGLSVDIDQEEFMPALRVYLNVWLLDCDKQ